MNNIIHQCAGKTPNSFEIYQALIKESKVKKEFITHFSQAWSDYKETKEYKELVDFFKNKKMNQPYIDNVIFQIFTAGYNSK